MKILRVQGEYFLMGEHHGEEFCSIISELAEERIDIICSTYPQVKRDLLRQVSENILADIQKQVKEVYDELKGIACGANIPLWKVVVAGGFSDIIHRSSFIVDNMTNNYLYECTILPVRNELGQVLLAGTWDSHATAESALVLIERRPKHGPATLALTTAGCPMQQGVTSKGIGFAIANVIPAYSNTGITYASALPRIVSQVNIQYAIDAMKGLRLCSGRFFAVCDDSGNYVGVETDGYQYWARNKLEVHTNHYIFENAKTVEGRLEYSNESEARRSNAEQKLLRIDIVNDDNLFDILSFNDGTPASIAKLGQGRKDRSGAAFVINPKNRSISFTAGPAGIAEPVKVKLNCIG